MPIQINSNRLFSEFLQPEELAQVNYFSYFACLESGNSVSILPSDHGLYYPLEFDKITKKIIKGELNFFNEVLYKNFQPGNYISNSTYSVCADAIKKERAIIINLMDNCYGHTFLKLLNLFTIYEKYSGTYDLWVLVPKPIKHFIPIDKFFIAEVSVGFSDVMNCYSLKPLVDEIKAGYKTVDFCTLDTYSSYNNKQQVLDFFSFTESHTKTGTRYVTFYYRSDYFRTWAGSSQSSLIEKYFLELRPYFDKQTEFVVVGDKDERRFLSWITDKRTNSFGSEVDFEYNSIFAASHLVVGLIGSNMLQPSMFCNFTIHLVPRAKTTIVAEEFFNVMEPGIQNWFNNIYLFGNENLSDIKPGALAEKTVLLYLTYLAKRYKKEIYTNENFKHRLSQTEYICKHFSFFDWEKANELKRGVTNNAFRFNLWRYRLAKFLKNSSN